MKELGITLDGYYIRATKTGAFVNVVDPDASVSKNVGFEVDGKINYKLAKNLSYFVEAGMFFPGKFYSEAFADIDGNPLQKKTVTMAVHGLILEF
jgi:hypothetical protein